MKEFMLKVREYLEATIRLSEERLNKNKEYLETVNEILRTKFREEVQEMCWCGEPGTPGQQEIERELVKDAGTNVKEKYYQKLANMCDTEHMTDEEAKLFIGEELGFNPLRVKIIHEVEDYYKDGNHIKKWHTYHRDPQYNTTDWNYFRFDVRGRQYEYTNGELRFYNS